MTVFLPSIDRFIANPLTTGGVASPAPLPGDGGLNPLFDRVLDIGEGFLTRRDERKNLELRARLEGQAFADNQRLLAQAAALEAQGRTTTPTPSEFAVGSTNAGTALSISTGTVIALGALALGAVVLLRQ